ncbi:MAG: tryptophan-rich sensory protein [Myxacorys californica WJT36-NPBG1]|jgi:tryptophan-rich sensory protein|nr:tryptophan-rich sensory protein [Myxacorys californica WJT36-NPBG1]
MKPWMIIASVAFLVSLGSLLIRPRQDLRWVKRLDLPRWLAMIQPLIPLIWTIAFTCGAWSAALVWHNEPGTLKTWLLMGIYLLVEIVTVSYIPLTLRLRSLAIGTIIGGLGAVLGILLAIAVSFTSVQAALLLLPYIFWSPIGTYATQEMIDLNPEAI